MTPTLEDLIGPAMSLPRGDRAELATRLIRSLDGPDPTPEEQAAIDAAWETEIERRVKEIEDGTAVLIPAEDAFASVRAKLDAIRKAKGA